MIVAVALVGATLLMSTICVDDVHHPRLYHGLTAAGCLLVVAAVAAWLVPS